MTPVPSSQNIRKYLEKRKQTPPKQEEEEECGSEEEQEEDAHARVEEGRDSEEDKTEKIGENIDMRKKTFSSVSNTSFQTTIQKFRMMTRGTECQIRRAYCSSHNVKVIREVLMKKVSDVDEFGKTSWSS